jgi:hypothetical protein
VQNAGAQALIDRMIGVARLDVNTYEEIEHDTSATTQAAIVVVLAAIAQGIGAIREDGFGGLIGGVIGGLIGWAVFSFVVYFVGTRILATPQTEADTGQLLRTLGFAYSPQLLAVFGFIPILGPILALIGAIWAIVTEVVAVRQALEMSTGRAVGTILLAALAVFIVSLIFIAIFGIALFGLG